MRPNIRATADWACQEANKQPLVAYVEVDAHSPAPDKGLAVDVLLRNLAM